MDIEIKKGNCIGVMQEMRMASVDLILTDPPYGVTCNEWDKVPNWKNFFLGVNRVLKKDGQLVVCGKQPMLANFYSHAVVAGFEFRNEMVWAKNVSGSLDARYKPLPVHELVWVFARKKSVVGNLTYNREVVKLEGGKAYYRELNNSVLSSNFGGFRDSKYIAESDGSREAVSILYVNAVRGNSKEYEGFPTQKPVELMRWFIEVYSREGDMILDPFMGSGSTLIAAKLSNRNAVGIELEDAHIEIAKKRLEECN